MKKTTRICLVCNEKRKFRYQKLIGHSECVVCGNRFGIHINTYERVKLAVLEEYKDKYNEEKYKKLQREYEKARTKILNQSKVLNSLYKKIEILSNKP